MSGLVNKVKEALNPDHSHTSSSTSHNASSQSAPEGTYGHHSSRTANAADPRIDSDRDNRGAENFTSSNRAYEGVGSSTSEDYGENYGSSGTTGAQASRATGPASATEGPYKSNTMNKADPRVDSDGSKRMGTTGNEYESSGRQDLGSSMTAGQYENSSTGRTGQFENTGRTGEYENTGRIGQQEEGFGSSTTGQYDSTSTGREGFGSSGVGSSDVTGQYEATGRHGAVGESTGRTADLGRDDNFGPGPASNTAGPHKSNMMNKADPRVDSDLDNSKTFGGEKTYQSGSYDADPRDAAQVPPSVMQKHIGKPMSREEHGNRGL